MNENIYNLRPARSIEINQKVYEMKRKGEKVITLSLGEAYFDIPDFGFDSIDHSKGYHYCDTQGLPFLREQVVKYLDSYHGAKGLDIDNLIISAGSKLLTYLTMQLVLNNGDNVILHEPAWLSYEDQAKLSNADVTYIPYDVEIPDFESYFSERTRLIVINNPNNPAGWIYNLDDLKSLISYAKSNNVYVLIDEAYSDFVSDGDGFVSCATLVPDFDNLIVVNSISKNFGMSGWRVGFAIANEEIIKKLVVLNQHTITCAPTLLQQYLADHLFKIHDACKEQIQLLLEKRKRVLEIFQDFNIKTLNGGATFYYFVDISKSKMTSEEFCFMLLEKHNVAVVPGSAYGRGTDHFIRLSFGTESIEDIRIAIESISKYLA